MAGKPGRRQFGWVRRLPSGRWQASYVGPDLKRHRAPSTFEAKIDADAWLHAERRLIEREEWSPPGTRRQRAEAEQPMTFAEYVGPWLEHRSLKDRTRAHYRRILDTLLLPYFGHAPLREITPAMVRSWHAQAAPGKPTIRAHAYGLLRTILNTAVEDEEIPANPCHIRGAGTVKRARKIKPATLAELSTIVEHMPPRYRALVVLSAWTALRFGEAAALRRRDVDLDAGVIRVERAIVRVNGRVLETTPKSSAGFRNVHIPPHIIPTLREHIASMPMRGRDALLFPAADGVSYLNPSTLYRVFYPARKAAGRPDLRWHDLRHTGAVLSAQAGATLADLMERLGHSTPGAALIYQHAAQGRDAKIAAAMSRIAEEAQ